MSTAQDCVVRFEQPLRRKVNGPDQSGLVRIVAHRHKIDQHLVRLEDHRRAADHQFADTAGAETSTNDDPLGVLPAFGLEIAPNDQRQLLGKVLNGTLHDASRFRVAFGPSDRRASFLQISSLGSLPNGSSPALRRGFRQFSMMSRNAPLLARSPMKPSSSFNSMLYESDQPPAGGSRRAQRLREAWRYQA